MPHELTSRWIDRFKTGRIEDHVRGDFYEIRRDFVTAARAQGFLATVEDAARLIDTAVPPEIWRRITSTHQETLKALDQVARTEPTTFLDPAILALLDARPGDAIRGYGAIHRERIANFAKYRSVLAQGHDRGLAIWQVMNPFYFLWSLFPVARGRASDRWKDARFDNQSNVGQSNVGQSDANPTRTAGPSGNDRVLLDFLRVECPETDWSTARVLECGSGDGHNAGLLIGSLGVAADLYSAFDLHDSRVAATKAVVEAHAANGAIQPSRFFGLDILSDQAPTRLASLGPVDVLFSASFTNVFNDDQLPGVLDRLAALKPALIVDISVITSWGLCVGRFDPSSFYHAAGYRLKTSRLEIPPLAANESHRLWMPEKYWANRNILLYETL